MRTGPSWVLAALVAFSALNGVGLGTDGVPFSLWRQLLYLPVIALCFAIGRRRRIERPLAPLVVGVLVVLGATVLDGPGQGLTMAFYSAVAVGLPWLVGQALRQQAELAAFAVERAEQVEATREAYAVAAAASLRQRLAADLHDQVGHDLALIALTAGILQTSTAGSTREQAVRLRQLASEATDRLRVVVGELSGEGREPVSVADVTLRARATGMAVTLVGDCADPLLVRATQEALTNAARHATGRPVRVEVGATSLLVTNDLGPAGAGAAPERPARGLVLLGERIRRAGGELQAGPDGGRWRVSVDLAPPP